MNEKDLKSLAAVNGRESKLGWEMNQTRLLSSRRPFAATYMGALVGSHLPLLVLLLFTYPERLPPFVASTL